MAIDMNEALNDQLGSPAPDQEGFVRLMDVTFSVPAADAKRFAQRAADARFMTRHPERKRASWRRATAKRYATDPDTFKAGVMRSAAKYPERVLWNAAKHRARKYGIPFSITPQSLLPLPATCPIFGVTLEYGGGKGKGYNPNAASLDQRDPALGYVPGNVLVMSRRANSIKNDGTAAEHRMIADWMDAGGDNGN